MNRKELFSSYREAKLEDPPVGYGYYFEKSYETKLKDMVTLIEFAFQVNDFVHMKMEKVFVGERKHVIK